MLFNDHGKLPSEFLSISRHDKAMVIAFMNEKAKQRKKEEKEMKRKKK